MKQTQKFGGDWTVEKLNILSDYLDFYLGALKNQKFGKIYIDAFAGSGKIETRDGTEQITGSIRLALKAKNKFDRYVFIEKNAEYAAELQRIVDAEFSTLKQSVEIYNADCNDKLIEICGNVDVWRKSRAVLFLDPYATEVKWAALEAISKTQAIDLWYLFPFSAAQRMLPNKGVVENWRNKLNELFGDTNWETRFYKADPQFNLFDESEKMIKEVNTGELAAYICERLKSIFPYVADNPRLLYNKKKSPLFLFCFAVANPNPKAYELAKKVAEDHILKKGVMK
ncbi:MAG: three-Cys-motif partner protein TcmP [Clostridiales Family XIII bacterium]|jgi:three-Cys-motif partner protein|nr:three-Cys-motif partner protein TcmP [Clostridiales Family XIII bacterium]